MTPEQFTEMSKELAEARAERDRSAGAYDELAKQLTKKFGIHTIKQAVRLLRQRQDVEKAKSAKLKRAEAAFKLEYDKYIKEFKNGRRRKGQDK